MSQNKLLPSVFNDMVTPPNSVQRRKSKPMIVDISINDQGEQIYQVQNNSRKRKYQYGDDDENDNDVTPIRSALGTISPNTLNQNKKQHIIDNDEKFNGSPNTRKLEVNDVNIWSEDVEKAFEQALRMIPKNGLTKIKISGKSCGRNELISDYIYQKTGKSRTRKQVSSHIQVIKNLKKNKELIELINNGPSNPQDIEKFDEIFSEISFQKSIGGTSTELTKLSSTPRSRIKRSSPTTSRKSVSSSRPRRKTRSITKPIEFNMKRFEMTFLDFDEFSNSHTFTKLSSPKLDQALRLKPNANISNRFPNLKDYQLTNKSNDPELQIPILHSMVNLNLPPLDKKTIDGKHETKLQVELKNIPIDETEFGCLTVIYSFGNEVIRLIDDVVSIKQQKNLMNPLEFKNHILELPFAKEFWNAFFKSIENNINDSKDVVKSETQKTIAVKAITMKQIIFVKDPSNYLSSSASSTSIHSDDIRSVLLWEFTKSNDVCSTTTRRLYLPNPEAKIKQEEEIQYISKVSEPIKEGEEEDDQEGEEEDEEEEEEEEEQDTTLEMPVQDEIIPISQPLSATSSTSTSSFSSTNSHQPSNFRTQSFPTINYFQTSSQPNLSTSSTNHNLGPQLRRMQSEPNTSMYYNDTTEFQSDDFAGFQNPSNNPITSTTSASTPSIIQPNVFNSFGVGANFNGATGGPTLNPGFIHLDEQIQQVDHHGEIFSW